MREKIRELMWENKRAVCVLVLFMMLAALSAIHSAFESEAQKPQITRQQEGNAAESQTFTYRTQDGTEQTVSLEVQAVERTRGEAQKLLDAAAEEWEDCFLGENTSVNEVTRPLNLPDRLQDNLVRVSYESENYDILDTEGNLHLESVPEEGARVKLTVTFSYSEYEREDQQLLNIVWPEEGSAEWIYLKLKKQLQELETGNRRAKSIDLPDSVEGYAILWESERDMQWMYFAGLGAAVFLCLVFQKKEKERQEKKMRQEQLLLEYPQMVEQLSLLIGSGMTIRGAWERMLKSKEQHLYLEEMRTTYRELCAGCGEREAYERFGTRIGLAPYRRFSSLLSQNLTKGMRDLRELMRVEAREALEMRKNHARRLGEEAGTKLLFPMLLMFALILVVLLVPATQSF